MFTNILTYCYYSYCLLPIAYPKTMYAYKGRRYGNIDTNVHSREASKPASKPASAASPDKYESNWNNRTNY